MGRNRQHTVEVRFSIRIEKRLNQALTLWAAQEKIPKERLIERELGAAVLEHESGPQIKTWRINLDVPRRIDSRLSLS